MTEYETIRVETRGAVGLITLDRPHALNALSMTLARELVSAAEAFDADDAVGAIVIAGSPKAFAAGADITELVALDYADMANRDVFAEWDRLPRVRIPIVAAVTGFALGGGCELAMMCDVTIAGESARFGQPEIALGVIPGLGGTQRLTRAIGKAKAMDLVLTGRMMDAAEAERAGLVARVVADDAVLETALEVAALIASRSRPAAAAAKDAVNRAFEQTLAEGLRAERRAFESLFALPDRVEGMSAFLEKREPRFER